MKDASRPNLIETMKADARGHIALLPYHLRRLHQSARTLNYTYPGDEVVASAIKEALKSTNDSSQSLNKIQYDEASVFEEDTATRVRLLLSPEGQLSIVTAALPALVGIPLIALTDTRLDSYEYYLQHKTTYRPWYDATTQWLAEHPDYFDLIFLNERGELCEGSRSNIYVYKEGEWLTPPLSSGLLGGVLRTELLETDQVREAILTPSDLTAGNASIRLSNALRGWFEVRLAPHSFQGISFQS